jgi:hypothetical protein
MFWLLFLFVPLTIIWILILTDLMRRADLVGWQKSLWIFGIIFFPWIASLIYLATRPRDTSAPMAGPAAPQTARVPSDAQAQPS